MIGRVSHGYENFSGFHRIITMTIAIDMASERTCFEAGCMSSFASFPPSSTCRSDHPAIQGEGTFVLE